MQLRTAARSSRPGGFSLIELMVVVAIATILFAVAVPSYLTYVRQSRRTEARTAVLDLAGREERFFSTNGATYSVTPAQLGYAALPAAIGGGYYQLSVCSPACAPSAVAAPSYTVTATAVGGQLQDLQCRSFSVDSTGRQFAVDSTNADATQYCWAN